LIPNACSAKASLLDRLRQLSILRWRIGTWWIADRDRAQREEEPVWELRASMSERAHGDNGAAANDRPVEDGCSHGDVCSRTDGAAEQRRVRADKHVVADHTR
jgi:hypothetical protein